MFASKIVPRECGANYIAPIMSDNISTTRSVPDQDKAIKVMYKNWKGAVRERWIIPDHIYWGSTQYRPKPQWLMRAYDFEDGIMKDFSLADMYVITE